jgi:23S rRNA (uracil1939-C5)-methyltransferase
MVPKAKVSVESMAFKGYGVARVDGKVVFIPYTVTGDNACIEIIEEKKNYSIGRLEKIEVPSPWRVNPPCSYFGICGGCQWQHIDYPKQVEFKKNILIETLERLGGRREIPSIRLIPSGEPYNYRVRVQLKVKGKALGYYQERSHRIVDIDRCLIAHPLINQMISYLRKPPPSFFRMEEIEINISPEEGKGMLLFHPLLFDHQMDSFAKELLKSHSIFCGIAIEKKNGLSLFGAPQIDFTISFKRTGKERNLRLRTSPGSFFQANLEQNQNLIQTVLEFSEGNEAERVLDLYAGVGNFTLPLAIVSKDAWGIEGNRGAVEDARFNGERNGIQNCNFIAGRVEDILKNWRGEEPDLIILDPPRTGCKTILDQVVRLKPKKIVYVSCEPTTFARDLYLFSERGFHLQRLHLVDMFPQTYHMEVVGLLH